MSKDEVRIADTQGRFALAVKSGRKLNSVSWNSCRILLSNKRIIFAQGDNKKQIPLKKIKNITDRVDVSQDIASVSKYIGFRTQGDNIILVSSRDQKEFDISLYESLLNNNMILCKHPAVEGGVITDEKWIKAKVKIEKESLALALKDGSFVELEYDNISEIDKDERTVKNKTREIVSVSHAIENTTLETYLTKSERVNDFIYQFLNRGQSNTETNMELNESEKEVLMGLYSGVSPFELPDFTGMDIEEVEEIYEELIEKDILEEIRVRREVSLTSRGRNLASDAISEE